VYEELNSDAVRVRLQSQGGDEYLISTDRESAEFYSRPYRDPTRNSKNKLTSSRSRHRRVNATKNGKAPPVGMPY